MNKLIRTIHPEVKIVDADRGVVDYVASDETLDYHNEVIRASGWDFTHFRKNAPFVDSHNYDSILHQLGSVIDFEVKGGKLIERVRWAIDVPDNSLAQMGWKMTLSGHLRAVSVGFIPTQVASRFDSDPALWKQQLAELGIDEESGVRRVFVRQMQYELSSVLVGANPNALAKAYDDRVLTGDEMKTLQRLGRQASADRPSEESDAMARLAIGMQIRIPGLRSRPVIGRGNS